MLLLVNIMSLFYWPSWSSNFFNQLLEIYLIRYIIYMKIDKKKFFPINLN